MQYLYETGWRTLAFDELLTGHVSGAWPSRSFVLTFDDGFKNFAEHGLPVLADYSFTAIVFVVAGWVGKTNSWPGQVDWAPRRALLSWDDLRTVVSAGMEIGAHSLSHPHLTPLPVEEMEREIAQGKKVIEDQIGCAVRTFAYPYGETTATIEEMVADRFQAGFATRLGYVTAGSRVAALERIDMYYLRKPWLFRAIEADWLDMYLRIRCLIRDLRRIERRAA